VDIGYKKSTVYKVYNIVKAQWFPVSEPEWKVKNITFGKSRYMPSETAHVSFHFENTSGRDLYLYRIGIQPEWGRLNQEWYAQEVRDLLKPRQERFFSFRIPVPANLDLGEYAIWFGVEGQYLPVTDYQTQITTTWCDPPMILHIKHPTTRYQLFISHSTRDLQLIRALEARLDLYGIRTTIAEDIAEPGANIWRKITDKIQTSTVLLAIVTDSAARSEWVIKEINYASQIKKPILLLKEKYAQIESPIEWVEFSQNDNPDALFNKIMDGLRNMESRGLLTSPIAGIIGLGILGLLISILFSGSEEKKEG